MLRSLAVFLSATCLALGAAPTRAFEQLPVETPPQQPQLVKGAKAVSPGDWPATLIFRTETGGCTSTLVGSRVVLTAAHCIGDGETGTITVGGAEHSVTCDRHPEYREGHADFALCLVTDGKVEGVAYELVSSALAYARLDDTVTLTGYGCIESGGRDRNFGMLHVGTATVSVAPAGDSLNTETRGGAALCFGDSGGPAYVNLGNNARVIVGVNSQGDLNERSILATTATPLFVDWVFKWIEGKDVRICGLHAEAIGCRS